MADENIDAQKDDVKALRKSALKNPTALYHPNGSFNAGIGWALGAMDGDPWYTWFDIPRMKRDPRVRLLEQMWQSPFQQVQWEIKASDPKIVQYVDRSLRRFWRGSLPALLKRYFWFGFAPGGAEFTFRNNIVRFDRVRPIEPLDARVEIYQGGEHNGRMAGFSFGNTKVLTPHAYWFAGHRDLGRYYDLAPASGMFRSWAEKNERGGAIHSRRLWFFQNSSRGKVVRYPVGRSGFTDENPAGMDNQDIAKEMADSSANNTTYFLPSDVNPADGKSGTYLWDVDFPEGFPDRAGYLEYPGILDGEMCEGCGIPKEALEASKVGSGWSGRMVPMLTWMGSCDILTGYLIESCEWLKYAVQINFGPHAWFEVEPQSLVEKLNQDSNGPGGPGAAVQNMTNGQPPQPGADGAPPGQDGAGGGPAGWSPYKGPKGGNGYQDPKDPKHIRYLGRGGDEYPGSPIPRETRNRVKKLLRDLADRERFLSATPGNSSGIPNSSTADPKTRRKQLMILLAMLEFQRRARAEKDPASCQPYIEACSRYLADPDALRYPLNMSWRADQTRAGDIMAVGEGQHAGRRLYKARAEAALRHQNRLGNREQTPTPHPNRQQWQQAGIRTRQILGKVANGNHTTEDLQELQTHLPYLPMSRLSTARGILRTQYQAAGGRLSQVKALMEHIRVEIGVTEQQATEEPRIAAHLGDAATPGSPNDGPLGRLAASHNDPEALQKHAQDLEIMDAVNAAHRGDAGPEIQGAVQRGGKWENHGGSLVKKYSAIGKELAALKDKPKEAEKQAAAAAPKEPPAAAPASPPAPEPDESNLPPVKVLKARKTPGPARTGTLHAAVLNRGGIDPKSASFLAHMDRKEAIERGFNPFIFRPKAKGGQSFDSLVDEMIRSGELPGKASLDKYEGDVDYSTKADAHQKASEFLLEGIQKGWHTYVTEGEKDQDAAWDEFYRLEQEAHEREHGNQSRVEAAVRSGEEAGHREAQAGEREEESGFDGHGDGGVPEAQGEHGEEVGDDSFNFGDNAKEPEPVEAPATPPADPFHHGQSDHTATIESIKPSELGWVAGHRVRNVGDGKYQVETEKAYKTGSASEIGEHIKDSWKRDSQEKPQVDKAFDRAKGFEEPTWFGGGDKAAEVLRRRGEVPEGARGVSLEPNTKGRVGAVVRDPETGATSLQLDGGKEIKATDFEPLERKFSWRVPEEAKPEKAKAEQGKLFDAKEQPASLKNADELSPSSFPQGDRDLVSGLKDQHPPASRKDLDHPAQDVPLATLHATQDAVDPAKVESMAGKDDLPPADVVRDDKGNHHIEDGHHRAERAKADGDESMPARVWEKGDDGFKAAEQPHEGTSQENVSSTIDTAPANPDTTPVEPQPVAQPKRESKMNGTHHGTHHGIQYKIERDSEGNYSAAWKHPGSYPGDNPYWAMASSYGLKSPEDAEKEAKDTIETHVNGEGSATFQNPLFARGHKGDFQGGETVNYNGTKLHIRAGIPNNFVASNSDDTHAVVFSSGDPAMVVTGPNASKRAAAAIGAHMGLVRSENEQAKSDKRGGL